MTMDPIYSSNSTKHQNDISRRSTNSRQFMGPPIPTVKIIVVVTVIVGIIVFATIFYLMVSFNRRQKRLLESRRQAYPRRMRLSSEARLGSKSIPTRPKGKDIGSSPARLERQSRELEYKVNTTKALVADKSHPKMPQKPPRLSLGSSVRRSRHENLVGFSPEFRGLVGRLSTSTNLPESQSSIDQRSSSSSSTLSDMARSGTTPTSKTASSKLYMSTPSSLSSLRLPRETASSTHASRSHDRALNSPVAGSFSPVLKPCVNSPTYISRSNSRNRAQSSGSIIIALDHPPVIDVPHPIISWNSSVFGKYTMKEIPEPPKSAVLKPHSHLPEDSQGPSLAPPRTSQRRSSSATSVWNSSRKSLSLGKPSGISTQEATPNTTLLSRSTTLASSNRFSASTWQTTLTEADGYSVRDSMGGEGILPPPSIRPSFIDYQRVSVLPYEWSVESEDVELGSSIAGLPVVRSPTAETKSTLTSITSLLRLYSNAGRNGNNSSALLPGNTIQEIASHRQTVHKFGLGQQSRATTPKQQTEFILPLFSTKKLDS